MNTAMPGEPGYEVARFNTIVEEHPAAVVAAESADDVRAAVRHAVDQGLPVAVQATGHTYTTPADDAVLINTRAMAGITVDPQARTARVEAGVRSGALIAAAAEHGLAPINGASPTVGTVGYTLGGGLGPLGRPYGFAVDHVRALELVLADGSQVTASMAENADLFWAARGSRGNFGVVTALTTDLVPVTRLYGGGLFFAADKAQTVLTTYREWVTSVPDEMTSSFALLRLPPFEAIPEPLRGKFVVHVRIAFTGSGGEHLVAPLRAAAPPLIDAVREIPYTEVASIHGDPTEPAPFVESSALLRAFGEDTVDTLLEVAGPDVDLPLTVVELRHLGGALGRVPERPSPVGFRSEAQFSVFAGGVGAPDRVEAVHASLESLVSRLAPWRVGGPFVSFLSGTDLTRVAEAYEPKDYQRLRELKAQYDPANVFRINHNIPPA